MQTPPPTNTVLMHKSSDVQSTISALTASAPTNEPVFTATTTPTKRRQPHDDEFYQSPSPKKAAPDFTTRPSDDSVCSGDDAAGWEREEDKIMAAIAAQNQRERDADNLDEDGVPAFFEFEIDADADNENPTPIRVTKTVTFKSHSVPMLKELYQFLGVALPSDKKKPSLFQTLRDSAKVTKIADDSFSYETEEVPESQMKGPRWEILAGMDVSLPHGIAPTGAQEGFFGPTNQENVVVAQMKSYLTHEDERIKRPEFARKPRKEKEGNAQKEGNANPVGRPKDTPKTPEGPPNERGGPPNYARLNLPKSFAAHCPKDCFDLQLSPEFVEKNMVNTTNERAAAEGTGSRTYKELGTI